MEMPFAIRCAQTMPCTVKMLNGPFSMNGSFAIAMLRRPISGSINVIQAMVVAMPGIMKETQKRNSML